MQLNYPAAKAPNLHHYMQTVVTINQKKINPFLDSLNQTFTMHT